MVMVENKLSAHYSWSSFGITDTGKVRERNEDSLLNKPEIGLWVVADGMGGYQDGNIASQMIVNSLSKIRTDIALNLCIDNIEDRLLKINKYLTEKRRASKNNATIGSTAVGMLAYDRFCTFFWAGDSRLYRLRNGSLNQLTADHSQVEAYIRQGLINRQDAADHPHGNMITRAVGAEEELYVDFDIQEMQSGDRYMLCSDGLTKHLQDIDFEKMLSKDDAKQACKKLIALTMKRGAGDNVTSIVIDIK